MKALTWMLLFITVLPELAQAHGIWTREMERQSRQNSERYRRIEEREEKQICSKAMRAGRKEINQDTFVQNLYCNHTELVDRMLKSGKVNLNVTGTDHEAQELLPIVAAVLGSLRGTIKNEHTRQPMIERLISEGADVDNEYIFSLISNKFPGIKYKILKDLSKETLSNIEQQLYKNPGYGDPEFIKNFFNTQENPRATAIAHMPLLIHNLKNAAVLAAINDYNISSEEIIPSLDGVQLPIWAFVMYNYAHCTALSYADRTGACGRYTQLHRDLNKVPKLTDTKTNSLLISAFMKATNTIAFGDKAQARNYQEYLHPFVDMHAAPGGDYSAGIKVLKDYLSHKDGLYIERPELREVFAEDSQMRMELIQFLESRMR